MERILAFRRETPHAVFDIVRPRSSAVLQLAELEPPAPKDTDDAWLRREELRGSRAVIELLETTGFADQPQSTQALFVDNRCGLIASELLGDPHELRPDVSVRHVLERASTYHASGIILVTRDISGSIADSPSVRQLTMEVYRKGEAIDVFLLDHFVLTPEGWRQMCSLWHCDRS
jgi:DNA repair protein RadC